MILCKENGTRMRICVGGAQNLMCWADRFGTSRAPQILPGAEGPPPGQPEVTRGGERNKEHSRPKEGPMCFVELALRGGGGVCVLFGSRCGGGGPLA